MSYFEEYINYIKSKNPDFASSIEKTASEISDKYLKKFDFNSNQTGLLFGDVQSGKTGHVFGIMCKAVDLGFQFFLMLTTDNVDLQKQTYERTEKDLEKHNQFIVCGEDDEQKFRKHGEHPVVIVLKKDSNILREWSNKLANIEELKGNPLFIIDDEADAASLNTKVNQHKVSTINKYLREIRSISQSSIYLQMTGTPQSLLLQSEESGWKPMFVYYFKPGKDYLGGNFFFPHQTTADKDRVPDFIRFIDEDVDSTATVKRVVIRHLVVTAQLFLTGAKVSNCIVHPSFKQNIHEKVKKEFGDVLFRLAYDHNDSYFKIALKREYDSIHPVRSKKQPFQAIESKVQSMLKNHEFQVVVLNSTSPDDAKKCENGCNFVIGGNSLGRGVTFGQLNTFYYTRSSKTPQADTMWQQSRVFGYDRDRGMVTIFITKELYNLFVQINNTNDEITKQVRMGEKPSISYGGKLRPTRMNVLDKSMLNILVGGSSYFPANPVNDTYEQISDLVKQYLKYDRPTQIPLPLMIKILDHFRAANFDLSGYKAMIQTEFHDNPLAKGYLLVRKNRNISYGKRALLSSEDWKMTNAFQKNFVLTLYQVNGHDPKLKWPGHKDLWVPNIKLPGVKNFYVI